MGFFEGFPFTNTHTLNLDWILGEVKKIPAKVVEAVAPVAKALDLHVEDFANPHNVTLAQVGGAPAGYGLGEESGHAVSDCNNAIVDGWYITASGAENSPFSGGAWLFVESYSTHYKIQRIGSHGYDGVTCQRVMSDGTWGEWEWVNPPMQLGVEYRTTERWNGKPVYTKLIAFGTFPNQTSKTIDCEVDGDNVFYSDAYAAPGNGYVPFSGGLLAINGSIAAWYAIDSSGVIWLTTNQDLTTYSGYLKIKYIKP